MKRKLVFLFWLAPQALAMTVSHSYANMAAFNFPVNSTAVSQYLHPSVTVDVDEDGMAWLSILSSQLVKTSIDGIKVPFIKPSEIQVRTYVTGPSPITKHPVKGVWLFDLFLDDVPSVLGAKVLFDGTIRVRDATMRIVRPSFSTLYNLSAPYLQVTRTGAAAVMASCIVDNAPVEFNTEFFLNRTGWFGQNKAGQLAVSMLHDIDFKSRSRKMRVSEFSSSVLVALGLGSKVGLEACEQRRDSCFFVGDSEATFDSSVIIPQLVSSKFQPLLV